MDPTVQSMVIEHVKDELGCPDGFLCNADLDTTEVLRWIEENVIFTQQDAENVCHEVEGACDRYNYIHTYFYNFSLLIFVDREWSSESCPADVEEVIFPHFHNEQFLDTVKNELVNLYNDNNLDAVFGVSAEEAVKIVVDFVESSGIFDFNGEDVCNIAEGFINATGK